MRSVLLVEDDAAFAEILSWCLTEAMPPWQVTVETTLQGALRWLQDHQPAVILLDLNLPDSRELATFERVWRAAGSIPIVVVTAIKGAYVEGNVVARGAVWYLDKVWVGAHIEEFLRSLDAFCEGAMKPHGGREAD